MGGRGVRRKGVSENRLTLVTFSPAAEVATADGKDWIKFPPFPPLLPLFPLPTKNPTGPELNESSAAGALVKSISIPCIYNS